MFNQHYREPDIRLKNLRPGNRVLSLKTVEDDSPPGTFAINLADKITFSDGSASKNGYLGLGNTNTFTIVVPNSIKK